jgi:hypothetical protein
VKRETRVFLVGLACGVLPFAMLTSSNSSLAQAQPVPLAAPAVLPTATPVFNGWLTLNPVANSLGGSITATLTDTAKVKGRPVTLQSSVDAGVTWSPIAKLKAVKLDSSGKAVFKVTPSGDPAVSYKAVAAAYKYKVKKKAKTAVAVETHPKKLSEQWKLAFEDNFSGTDFNSAYWARTANGHYGVESRWCSAPLDANGSVSGGRASLTMSKANSATTKAINAQTIAKQKAAKAAAIAAANKLKGKAKTKALKAAKALKTNGCPTGVFGNARVSTEGGKFKMKTGILAAEVTFPVGQGMHGGVWLQSTSDSEIDMVEAFGYRKGIQNVLHVGKYDTPEAKKWVAKSSVKKYDWWKKSHLFSMEWTRTQVTFRVDGAVTKVEKKALPDAEYSIVLSMLSSDWETGRLKKPVSGGKKAVLPASMKVNWVKAWTPVA